MRDLKLDLLFDLSGHTGILSDGYLPTEETLNKALAVEINDWDRAEQLAHRRSIRVFFVDSNLVPVVQRIERRFPNPKGSPSHGGDSVS